MPTNFDDITIGDAIYAGPQGNQGTNILRKVTVQGDSALDLTSTDSTATLLSQDDFTASAGGDNAIVTDIYGEITTVVAADSTAPIVTIQDTSGNTTGATITITDGDADGDLVRASVSDGTAVTPVDLTSEGMRAKVTTAAADAGTATGEVKIFVDVLLVS